MAIGKELDWLLGVVGPINLAVSCRLDDTSTLHRWVDGGVEPDPRSEQVVLLLYDVFHRLLVCGLTKSDIRLFYQSLNDDFGGCSPVMFMRENDPGVFRTRFFKHFDRVRMERSAGEAFARAGNHGLSRDELADIVDAENLGVLFHLVSAAAAVYDQDGVESLLRSSYSGVSSREVLCLLRSVDDRDKLLLYEIIERLQHDA